MYVPQGSLQKALTGSYNHQEEGSLPRPPPPPGEVPDPKEKAPQMLSKTSLDINFHNDHGRRQVLKQANDVIYPW